MTSPAPIETRFGSHVTADPSPETSRPHVDSSSYICVVGSSAGGLSAMIELFTSGPYHHMSFVVVQHLPADHKSELASILSRKTSLEVEDAQTGTIPRINTIHVVPADSYLLFSDNRMVLHKRALHDRIPITIDTCLESLARQLKTRAVAVILSGTGSDGTQGLRAIRANNGYAYVQKPGDAECASMPQSALSVVDSACCLPAGEIAQKLSELAQPGLKHIVKESIVLDVNNFDTLAKIVLERCSVDLREYKKNTLERRLERRIRASGRKNITEYIDYIKRNTEEAKLLTDDMFINVTRFFRDNVVFKHLETETFRRLIRENPYPEGLRFWCLGCSTGEEAYGLAIALHLAMEAENKSVAFKIVASDIDSKAIAVARRGLYSKDIAADIDPAVLKRFFSIRNGGLQVDASLRVNILFSNHDVLNDPPFSNIDFVSCRNLLIYFRPLAQRRCLDLIHYALRDQGTLLLGNSESIGEAAELFVNDKRELNIYQKCSAVRQARMVLPAFKQSNLADSRVPQETANFRDIRRDTDATILRRFGEPGVVVASNLNVLEVRGDVSRYLGLNSGMASFNLLRFAPVGMHKALEQVIRTAGTSDNGSSSMRTECIIEGVLRLVYLQVVVINRTPRGNPLYLVIFSDDDVLGYSPLRETAGKKSYDPKDVDLRYVTALENELHVYKERLDQAIDDREISLEEAKYVGQEAQASHEELQSFIEELETSREEIQSSNEELTVVNQEFRDRMSELEETHHELQNVLKYGCTCMVAINADFCIYRFSSVAANLFTLNSLSCGRSLSYLQRFLIDCDLHDLAKQATDGNQRVMRNVKHADGFDLGLVVQPVSAVSGEKRSGCLFLFSVVTRDDTGDPKAAAVYSQPDLEKRWLFAGDGVAIVTGHLVAVWANLAFYRLTRERRETFVSHPLSSGSTQHIFNSSMRQALNDFSTDERRTMQADELKTINEVSAHFHVIDVTKLARGLGQEDLLRITFEEKHHE